MFLQFLIGSVTPQTGSSRTISFQPVTEERALLSAAIQGEQSAYSQLVRRYQKMVLSIALEITGSREDAEEAVQDTFLKAFRYLPGYRGDSSFKTWLYRIARTTALDQLRRKRIQTVSPDIAGAPAMQIPEPGANSLQVMIRDERTDLIKKAMKQLVQADEAALKLFYFHDQSIEEISTTMGWTVSNTKSRLSRARQRLRIVLGETFRAEVE